MRVTYQQYRITIRFKTEVQFTVNPLFLLRSVFGCQLHAMCCLAKETKCQDCIYNEDCCYATLFETILPKDNNELPGRVRASHPFIIKSDDYYTQKAGILSFDFIFILLGKYVKLLPYVYSAFVRAGRCGIFKNNTEFEISDIRACFRSGGKDEFSTVFDSSGQIKSDIPVLEWNSFYGGSTKNRSGDVLVRFLSPLRFKTNNKYAVDFTGTDFMQCLARRMYILCSLYGESDGTLCRYAPEDCRFTIKQKAFCWEDLPHYSARQKTEMSLGGIKGSCVFSGTFSPYDLALFDFSRIFSAGKNTNFGLGQADFWYRFD